MTKSKSEDYAAAALGFRIAAETLRRMLKQHDNVDKYDVWSLARFLSTTADELQKRADQENAPARSSLN